MKPNHRIVLTLAVAAILSACSSAPPRHEQLEAARALVLQVESSSRAGVAAADIANARRSLDAADRLAASRGKRPDIDFEATNAALSAQIAHEKIYTAQANEQIASGTARRQGVLLAAREREVQQNADQAGEARAQADASQARADSLQAELTDLQAKKTERGLVLTLGDVLFDTGQATLKAGAYATLDRLATVLRDKPGRKVLIEGHTDNVGADASNQSLSEHRAHSVQSALMQRGAAHDQITALGKGEGFPIASNDSADGRRANRRVELIFTDDETRAAAGT